MRFELRAMTAAGAVESLALEAADEVSARREVAARGYVVLRVRARAGAAWRLRRQERFPVAAFSQELVVLLDAGLPLVEAIDTLAEKEAAPAARGLLAQIAAALRQGHPFSAALERCGAAFPSLYVATVRASEKTSDLGQALSRYVGYHARLDAVRRRVVNASLYPLLLLAVGGLVTLFLMLYVVPRFAHIYEDRGAALPLLSRLLLAWGKAADGHAVAVVLALAAVVGAIVFVFRSAAWRARIGELLWRTPSIGERLKLYQLARFYRTVGMLLSGGMPLVASLQMCAELLHPAVRAPLCAALRGIAEGLPLSHCMERHRLATPVALRMLAVGERGGNMGEMMERIAAFHDEEMTRWVEGFTRLFEPLLMAAIGLVIGTIVVLMYMPIFELAGSIG